VILLTRCSRRFAGVVLADFFEELIYIELRKNSAAILDTRKARETNARKRHASTGPKLSLNA
jgi:hypothetical protein